MDTYKYLIDIYNNTDDNDVKKEAGMYISQYQTASGKRYIMEESVNFIYKNRKLSSTLMRRLNDK